MKVRAGPLSTAKLLQNHLKTMVKRVEMQRTGTSAGGATKRH
jgi:hypothetical protein